jgi:hypothetical protein
MEDIHTNKNLLFKSSNFKKSFICRNISCFELNITILVTSLHFLHNFLISKNEKRLMMSPCCLSLYPFVSVCVIICISIPIYFEAYTLPSARVSLLISVRKIIRLSCCLCVAPNFLFSLRSLSYQRKVSN